MWVFCVIWNFFRRGRPLCRPVVLYLVQTYKSARNLKIFCHCEERSDVAIRFSLRRQYSFVQCKGDADSHDQFANWSRNDSKSFPRLLFSLSEITKDRRPLSHGSRRASVSLRLGHGAALTCPQHVRAAPPLRYLKGAPRGCGASPYAIARFLPRSASPLTHGSSRSSCARSTRPRPRGRRAARRDSPS